MYKLVSLLVIITLIACSTDNSSKVNTENQHPIDEGQFDSIIIYNDTKAPTKAIKALEDRAYFLDSFPSKDSLIIFADIYIKERNSPTILLCHQAGYSRGEYKETAKTLNLYGYSVVALDQRSGGAVNGVLNLSHRNALKDSVSTSYINALQDIEAAVDYIYAYTQKPILLLGSSYSATLSLLIAKNNPKIKAVAAFSPGEYFESISIQDSLKGFDKPLFITSSKQEALTVSTLIKGIEPHLKNQFTPTVNGFHGSKALWPKSKGNELYWDALSQFLTYEFPAKK